MPSWTTAHRGWRCKPKLRIAVLNFWQVSSFWKKSFKVSFLRVLGKLNKRTWPVFKAHEGTKNWRDPVMTFESYRETTFRFRQTDIRKRTHKYCTCAELKRRYFAPIDKTTLTIQSAVGTKPLASFLQTKSTAKRDRTVASDAWCPSDYGDWCYKTVQ